MARTVALLRGINVGGKNIIKIADLRACFEDEGFTDVSTYIQSGNVVFSTSGGTAKALTARIEKMLKKRFDYQATVMLRSRSQMKKVLASAPAGFGDAPDEYRYDVMFLQSGLTPKKALADIPTNPEVDAAYQGPGVIYFTRLTAKATRSRLPRITGMPIYQRITVRNWRTTNKLVEMLDAG